LLQAPASWAAQARSHPRSYCSPAAFAGGTVFVGGDGGTFSALEATTGTVIWSVHLVNNGDATGAGVANGVAYVTIAVEHRPDRIIAMDAATGGVLWDTILDFHSPAAPIIADGVVYTWARYRGAVGAFSAKNGPPLLELHVHPSHGVTGAYVADGRLYVTNSAGLSRFDP
jgi:outer membrane protein assembly factor BamB